VKWAREQLLAPNEWLILDTETTGLSDAEIVEIAIIDRLRSLAQYPSDLISFPQK
jgi:hypothetical protein